VVVVAECWVCPVVEVVSFRGSVHSLFTFSALCINAAFEIVAVYSVLNHHKLWGKR